MLGTNRTLKNVGILSTGKYLPEKVITNSDWEKLVDTSDEWIVNKIGIKERRFAASDEVTSDLGVKAVEDAIKRANISLDEIDLLISGSNTPDYPSPQLATMMLRKLGIKNTPGFDVRSGGCSSGVFSLSVGARFVADGTYKTVAVVIPEINSRVISWKDRSTCVILGDGAGCYILRATKEGTGILFSELGSDPSGYFSAYVPAGGDALPLTKENIDEGLQYFHMDGPAVWKFGTSIIPKLANNISMNLGIPLDNVDLFLTHQANINIIRKGLEDLKVPFEKALINVDRYGNMAGANLPVALTEAVDDGVLTPGKLIYLIVFGAGLSYASMAIRWCAPEDFE
ncbi:3-oxoacyl-ACP synthase [Bacillus cereus]|uniref:3-oxoacyl-ACP synthase III family protein n=1 Tax=Bacillus sp. AFS023182 TaxID=2033492 RepID=UPI000BF80578|nr:ketoacyl-ACP synthase III [Bacillus sp. AFS023182]PFE01022.1 3-oxoacyl-ACP synthase [Bacillus sp. AFS023182]PGX91141.1 3-oxoacyl-ACP synthase [Bacillus cereus]